MKVGSLDELYRLSADHADEPQQHWSLCLPSCPHSSLETLCGSAERWGR